MKFFLFRKSEPTLFFADYLNGKCKNILVVFLNRKNWILNFNIPEKIEGLLPFLYGSNTFTSTYNDFLKFCIIRFKKLR